MVQPTFAEWLRGNMEARKLSQKELAQRMKLSPSNVSRWLHGQAKPGVSGCVSLAVALLEPLPRVLAAAGYAADTTSDDSRLAPDEQELLVTYRRLPPPLKSMFLVVGRESAAIADSLAP